MTIYPFKPHARNTPGTRLPPPAPARPKPAPLPPPKVGTIEASQTVLIAYQLRAVGLPFVWTRAAESFPLGALPV